jgi:hypothetical protein
MTFTTPATAGPARLTDRELQARITSPDARCGAPANDPDEWFPVTSEPAKARAQSSHVLALCATCAVRAECLELALRHAQNCIVSALTAAEPPSAQNGGSAHGLAADCHRS